MIRGRAASTGRVKHVLIVTADGRSINGRSDGIDGLACERLRVPPAQPRPPRTDAKVDRRQQSAEPPSADSGRFATARVCRPSPFSAAPVRLRLRWSGSSNPARCPARAPVIGVPLDGEKDVVGRSASAPTPRPAASGDSGTWTAIWSPSKSALNAVQTSGWILMAFPSTSTGSNAWMPEPVKRRRAVQQHGVLVDHLLEDVPDLRLVLLDHLAWPV